jgi:electron transport complex protein RnfG
MTLWSEITLRLTPIVLGIVLMTWQITPVQAEDNNRMSIEQAQALIFPSATQFIAHPVHLSDDQKDAISEASDLRVRFNEIPLWQAIDKTGKRLGVIITDKVIGKHEFITYAVGISNEAKTTAPFILDYRESYGLQVERDEWRNQFVGKMRHDKLKVGKDIDNISGATLSCVNISNGIRRLLVSYDIAIAPILVKIE